MMDFSKGIWWRVIKLEWWKWQWENVKNPQWWESQWWSVKYRWKHRKISKWRKAWSVFWEIVPIALAVTSLTFLVFYLVCEIPQQGLEALGEETVRNLSWLLGGSIGWYFLVRRTRVAEQGVTVERLTRAMEQLDSEHLSVRLGGILGLEQIAESQKEERKKILQILSTRIREIAPREEPEPETTELIPKPSPSLTEKEIERLKNRQDVMAAVNALARIASKLTSTEKNEEKNSFHLRNTDFRFLNFEVIDLSFFDLSDVDFSYAQLTGINFSNANLQNSIFIETSLVQPYLKGAYLGNTDLKDVYDLGQEEFKEIAYHTRHKPPRNMHKRFKLPTKREVPKEDEKEEEDESSNDKK